jgi:hypothetical protein
MDEMTTAVAECTASAPARLPLPPRFQLGRTPIDRISMDYAAVLMVEALLHRGELPPLTVVGPNAHLVTMAERNSRFAEAMQDADLVVPDGISVVLASRVLGVPIPERVTGGDLMERMCAEASASWVPRVLSGRAAGRGGDGGAQSAEAVSRSRNMRNVLSASRASKTMRRSWRESERAVEDASPGSALRGIRCPETGNLDAGESRAAEGGRHHGGGCGFGYAGRATAARAAMDPGDCSGVAFPAADGAAPVVAQVPDREHAIHPAGDAAVDAGPIRSVEARHRGSAQTKQWDTFGTGLRHEED